MDEPPPTNHHGNSLEPGEMMLRHPVQEPWPNYALIILGTWLLFSPFSLGYESQILVVNDLVTGSAMIVLASLALATQNGWATYAVGAAGSWLLFAPLVFWAPSPVAYANDTLIGILALTFAILIPMRGTMSGPDVPPGWSYNPSTGLQRAPIIALALVGFFFSQHLTSFQLGYIDWVFEPVFGDGTIRVLTSAVSEAFPISDAGLGSIAYAVEVLMGFMGDKRRWRTMPWMVSLFGIVVIPLGFVSIVLIILQPLAVDAWCTLCLLSAFAMLWMIALTVDEVVAMGQFLARRVHQGDSLWHVFWMGGTVPENEAGDGKTVASTIDRVRAMAWGVSIPWTLLASAALGLWLMLSPTVFGTTGSAADSSNLIGALIVSFGVIAMGEPARVVRFLNIPLGVWTAGAPWLLAGSAMIATWNSVLVGILLLGLSIPRGPITDHYGTWQRYVV